MTVREVTGELTRRYAKRLERPQVDVLVTKPRARIDDFFSVLLRSPSGPIQEVTLTNGVIELPMIRSIEARGRTLGDVRRAVQSAYADVLPELRVGVLLLKRAIRSITVLGEVTKGGEFESPYPISAMRALALAGGVTDRARLTQVLLIRPETDGRLATTVLDMKKALDGSDATVGATTVFPNDVLYVPKSKIANVDVFVDQYIRKILPINPSLGAFTPF
jgi:protein involved in polysaccharide export with SLBB domain